jgi:hypothetical protein
VAGFFDVEKMAVSPSAIQASHAKQEAKLRDDGDRHSGMDCALRSAKACPKL